MSIDSRSLSLVASPSSSANLTLRTGYQDEPRIGWLNTTMARPPGVPDAAAYWGQFPKLDRFRSCRLVHDANATTDPNAGLRDEL